MAQVYGTMMGDCVLVSADGAGLPVTATDAPEAPDGYTTRYKWVSTGSAITQVWEIVPNGGTAAEAAVSLAQMQAAKLPDEDALKVVALFPAWVVGMARYTAGERVTHGGKLYRCLQTHAPQLGWEPGVAASLWAEVLPGQPGAQVGEWKQPDSTNPYSKGDKVTHNGKTWESLVDNNVWEPGATGSESLWKEVEA